MSTPDQPNDKPGAGERVQPPKLQPRPLPKTGPGAQAPSDPASNGTSGPAEERSASVFEPVRTDPPPASPSGPSGTDRPAQPVRPDRPAASAQDQRPAGARPVPPRPADGNRGPAASRPDSGRPNSAQPAPPRPPVARPVEQPSTQAMPSPAAPDAEDRPETGADKPVANGRTPAPGQQPPWTRGPQREPQSNLHRPGEAPVAGRPKPQVPLDRDAPTSEDPAAKSARRQAAQAKSAAIDGPTRRVARPELSKDMPDLSDVRHPLPEQSQPHRSAPAPVGTATAVGEPLRATIQIRRIDPWSTLKISFVLSVALFFVWMVAVGLLYVVLDGMGVWDRLNNAFTDIVSESNSGGLISAGQVFGYAALIGVINVVLITALATIGSFIYNQCSDLVGGVEVTLADRD